MDGRLPEFIIYSLLAFVFITFMEDFGMLIGFGQMEDLGVALLLGDLYMRNRQKDSSPF